MSIAAELLALSRLRGADLGLTLAAAAAMVRARALLRGGDVGALVHSPPPVRQDPVRAEVREDPVRVAAAVRRVDRVVPGSGRCLVSSLALRSMLAARGMSATLQIGVERRAGAFGAHAWVEHEGRPLLEPGAIESSFARLVPVPRRLPLLLGEVVDADVELPGAALAPPGVPPTVSFRTERSVGPPAGVEVERGPERRDGPGPLWSVSRGEGFTRISMPGGSDLDIAEDLRSVVGRPSRHGDAQACAQEFLGPGLGILAALRGRLVLHAAAVEHDGAAIALLGHSGQGKSTLARGLAEVGMCLFADDVVAVAEQPDGGLVAHAGSRAQKLHPGSPLGAAAVGGEVPLSAAKRWVPHDGGGPSALALGAVFVLDRSGQVSASAERLRGAEAFAALLTYSALAGLMQPGVLAGGVADTQNRLVAAVADRAPVFRLRYRDGRSGIEEAAGAIVASATRAHRPR